MYRIMRQIEALQADVTAWQRSHRRRVDALERRVSDIDLSVAHARASALRAASQMYDIEWNVLRRIEQIEQLMEIRLLVRQGRIPAEYLPARFGAQGRRQGSGVDDD